MNPSARFEQFVHWFLPSTHVGIVTADCNDESAQVMGAVIRFREGEECNYDFLSQFEKMLQKNHPGAKLVLRARPSHNEDCPEDRSGCGPECVDAHLEAFVTWPRGR